MIVEATAGDEAALIAPWEACGLTRAWNPPARDIAFALAGPSSTILVARGVVAPEHRALDRDHVVSSLCSREGDEHAALTGSVMVGHDGHRGWVYYLAVAPDARRAGLGRALMAAAETWLRAREVPKIQLMVRTGNEDAHAFYRALGFADQPVAVFGRFLD